jgi:CheY-like chemotaxis protein
MVRSADRTVHAGQTVVSKHDALIMLVEDEPMLQFVFERQLVKLGYKLARIVDNGLLAVEAVLGERYDLVFMDVRLPGLDGISATERIRAAENEVGKHTKIIGMTAFAHQQRCLESGMDDFLQKPVLLEQLNETIEKWLNPANQAVIEVVLSETTEVSMEHFQKTATRLEAIQARIMNLRKRVGLDGALTE